MMFWKLIWPLFERSARESVSLMPRPIVRSSPKNSAQVASAQCGPSGEIFGVRLNFAKNFGQHVLTRPRSLKALTSVPMLIVEHGHARTSNGGSVLEQELFRVQDGPADVFEGLAAVGLGGDVGFRGGQFFG